MYEMPFLSELAGDWRIWMSYRAISGKENEKHRMETYGESVALNATTARSNAEGPDDTAAIRTRSGVVNGRGWRWYRGPIAELAGLTAN